MTKTKPKGALIKFRADCGHWMDCYALEPTPSECGSCDQKRFDAEADDEYWATVGAGE